MLGASSAWGGISTLRRHEEVPFMCWVPHVDGSDMGVLSAALFKHKCMLDARVNVCPCGDEYTLVT